MATVQTSGSAELMLPLQPEIRRELFDVNLFDRPDEPWFGIRNCLIVFFVGVDLTSLIQINLINPGGFLVAAWFSHTGPTVSLEEPYADYPVENGIIKTTCVIDAVQAATYLGKAAVNIYRAEICPDDEPLGCTAPVAHAVTSFIWVAAFLSSAASTCAESVRAGPSCVAAIMRDLATAGSTIYGFDEDCFLTHPRDTSWRVYQRWYEHLKPEEEEERRLRSSHEASQLRSNISAYRARSAHIAAKLRNLTAPEAGGRARLPNVLFNAESAGLPRGLVDKLQAVKAIDGKHSYKTERNSWWVF